MPTDFSLLDRLYPLPPHKLPRQWVLTRDADLIPGDWERRRHRGWHLASHQDARVTELRSQEGRFMGWAVEALVMIEGGTGVVVGNTLTLPIGCTAPPAEIEALLFGRGETRTGRVSSLEGSWTAIILGDSEGAFGGQVYVGPTHSVMFSADRQVVATSHNLIPDVRRNLPLSRAFDPLSTLAYYTFGLTAFENVRRLLPNHYLDLATFESHRHWPRTRPAPFEDGRSGAALVVDYSRLLIEILSQQYRQFRLFLSAGRDSRAVLATLRPLVEDGTIGVELRTSYGDDLGSRVDRQAACRLAQIANLPHVVSRRQPFQPKEAEVMEAFVRIGEARGGRRLADPARVRSRQSNEVPAFALGGMAGETARGFYWNPPVSGKIATPELVASQTGLPVTSEVLEAAERWLDSLPVPFKERAPDVMDLAYIEQRMGCWEFASRYLFSGPLDSLNIMATGSNIQTMLRLPEQYRAVGRLQRDMIEYGWPELLEVPFNQPTGLLRLKPLVDRVRGGIARRLPRASHAL
jgi:hypothetical protein